MSLIHCQQLSRHYGSKHALSDINLSLNAGEPIALVGPNGAGKTTLFSLLLGYIRPSSGRIEILGHPPGHRALKHKIGALPQDAQLDPDFSLGQQLSLFAELRGMSAKAAKAEAKRVLDLVQLEDSFKQKPTELSHGMSKRVAIAQALIGQPELVLLDEPTAGIDPANARIIRELIAEQSAHTTFMVSSHNLDELERLCDQVVFLENGTLKQQLSLKGNPLTRANDTTNSTPSSPSEAMQYFTLQLYALDKAIEPQVQQAISALDGVSNVTIASQHTFVIEYHPTNTALDIALLTLCQQHQWRYRLLLNGRSLEDTLFSGS